MGASTRRVTHPTPQVDRSALGTAPPTRPWTLVWIDSRSAVIARRDGASVRLTRLTSDVPARHRSTGHVRHDPRVRHGGGGSSSAGEPNRLEHLHRFVVQVAGRLSPRDDVLILGPASVRKRLEQQLANDDAHDARQRTITCQAAPALTDGQLRARLRALEGDEPRRRTVGAYRWSESPVQLASGAVRSAPHRVADKPRRADRTPDQAVDPRPRAGR